MPNQVVKHVTIVLGGSGEQRVDVEVTRGVTTRDLLEQMHLTGHLSKYGDPAPFAENEDVYTRVKDGDKLILTPAAIVAQRRFE